MKYISTEHISTDINYVSSIKKWKVQIATLYVVDSKRRKKAINIQLEYIGKALENKGIRFTKARVVLRYDFMMQLEIGQSPESMENISLSHFTLQYPIPLINPNIWVDGTLYFRVLTKVTNFRTWWSSQIYTIIPTGKKSNWRSPIKLWFSIYTYLNWLILNIVVI